MNDFDSDGLLYDDLCNEYLESSFSISPGENFTGLITERHQTGCIAHRGYFNQGRRIGQHATYYESGSLRELACYRNGWCVGTRFEFQDNSGQPLTVQHFGALGSRSRNFIEKHYINAGQLVSAVYYSKDTVLLERRLGGAQPTIDFNSFPYAIKFDLPQMKFSKGSESTAMLPIVARKRVPATVSELFDGVYEEFWGCGQLRYRGAFVDGNATGQHVVTMDDGTVGEFACFRNGRRFGIQAIYDQLGHLDTEFHYSVNGSCDGTFILAEYDATGGMSGISKFVNGRRSQGIVIDPETQTEFGATD